MKVKKVKVKRKRKVKKPGAALTAPPAKAGSSAMIIVVIECRK